MANLQGDQNFVDFMRQWGPSSSLDKSFLKGSGLESSKWELGNSYNANAENGDVNLQYDPGTETLLKKYSGYTVKHLGEDSSKNYYSVVAPNGSKKTTSITKTKDSVFDKIMYSGAPFMLLAPGLGTAIAGAT